MTHPAQRPIATLLALAITLSLWAPTLSSARTAPSGIAGPVVMASSSSIVLM